MFPITVLQRLEACIESDVDVMNLALTCRSNLVVTYFRVARYHASIRLIVLEKSAQAWKGKNQVYDVFEHVDHAFIVRQLAKCLVFSPMKMVSAQTYMSDIMFASKRAIRHASVVFTRDHSATGHGWLLRACNDVVLKPHSFMRRWFSMCPPNPSAHWEFLKSCKSLPNERAAVRALSLACDASASSPHTFQDHLKILCQELQEHRPVRDSDWFGLQGILNDFCNKYQSKTRFHIDILTLLVQNVGGTMDRYGTPAYWFERFIQTMIHSCPLDQVSELVSDVSKTTLMDPFLTVVKKLVRLEIDHVAFWGTEIRFNEPLWHKFMQIVPTYVLRNCKNLSSYSTDDEVIRKLESLKGLLSMYAAPSGKRRRRGRKRLK